MDPEAREALRRWRAGDLQAFDDLYRLANPPLLAFCRLLAQDEGSALDLVQDAWKRVFAKVGNYREDSSFGAWLSTLAYHLWVDRQRREAREARALQSRREDYAGETATPPERPLLVREALARLSSEQRAAVLLYDLQGLSLRETAEAMKVSFVTVRTRLAEAHAALAKLLPPPENF